MHCIGHKKQRVQKENNMSELMKEVNQEALLKEAARCLKCKVPKCRKACPISTDIPTIMNLFLEGNEREAGRVLFENNPLSAICSIVCPHENNCHGNCVLGIKQTPISFYQIEQYVSGKYIKDCRIDPPEKNGMKIAVIGAGPAGISMSIFMAQKGFQVTLMEAQDQIGGVLRYGIPDFRLPRERVDAYKEVLRRLGVSVKPNCHIGSNLLLEDMFIDGYDAIFLAVGTAKPNRLGLLGETLGHVHFAIDFLKSPKAYDLGKTVAVIGAGNVAMDVARTAMRQQGVEKVILLNNRREEDVTATKTEYAETLEEGVVCMHLISVLRITEDGLVAVDVDAVPGENGIHYEENMLSRHTIEADSVILAIGQGPADAFSEKAQIATTLRGLFVVDENGMTNIPGVFAAGDVVSGPKTVVEAVAHTKKVAEQMVKYCYEKKEKVKT
jgi:glutamate synthase (NADPH/NADH) small chain